MNTNRLKKWLFSGTIVFFQLAYAQNQEVLTPRPLINQINFVFVKNCCSQAEELRTDLLAIIHAISSDIEYWKMEKLRPLHYFLAKGPVDWFATKSQNQELSEKIAFLKKTLDKNAYYLGKINSFLSQDYTLKTSFEIENDMRSLLLLIEECISQEHPLSQNIINQEGSTVQWLELVITNKKNLLTFKKRMLAATFGYKKPNHLRRNWLAYSALGMTSGALALYAYYNEQKLKRWYSSACIATNNYLKNHVQEPVKNTWDVLQNKELATPLVSEKAVETEQKTQEYLIRTLRERQNYDIQQSWYQEKITMVLDYFFKRAKVSEKKSEIEIDIEVQKAREGDLSEIIKDRNQQIQTPLLNSLSGDLLRLEAIEIHDLKKRLFEFLLVLQSTHKTSQLLIQLLALFPTVILGKFAFSTVKSGIDIFNKKNNVPLQKNIRLIHRTLNSSLALQELSWVDQGMLYYWVSELKKSMNTVPLSERPTFEEDLDDLLSQTLDTEQKKAAVHRMYSTYSFLTPCSS